MIRTLKELRTIPGVGKSIAWDLYCIGIRSVADLKKKKSQDLYDAACRQAGKKIDRCLLYVFRCAVYFASHTRHEPELLKWWNWKDKKATDRNGKKLK